MLFTRHFLGAKSKNTNVWTIIGCDRVASTRTNQLQACADMRCRNYGGENQTHYIQPRILEAKERNNISQNNRGLVPGP